MNDHPTDLDKFWLDKGVELVARARRREIEDIELAVDVTGWPDTWVAAELLTYNVGTEFELAAGHIVDMAHVITASPAGDVVALLERAEAASGDERIAALEAAWRACFAPELADAIEALDAARDAPAMPVAKKKKDTEALWAVAAERLPPRSLFAGEWPKQWRDAQRRMRPIYARPRSPLFAAAAIDFTRRDPLPYTSIASSTYWRAHTWFIAEQCDVRQLAALEAFEQRMTPMWGASRIASEALRAVRPRDLSDRARTLLAKLAVPAKPKKAVKLSLASPEERSVAADQLLIAGDPRGEFITVQQQIAEAPTPALVKRQAQLIKKHAKTWVPNTVYRDTCVFRGGVPVAGHLQCRSDPELASMVGSAALATFETLIIDTAFAMGDIEAETIANVARSLPGLRTLVTTDEGAEAIARGAPTNIEHIVVPGNRTMALDGPGLPKLARVDVDVLFPKWVDRWAGTLAAIGVTNPVDWDALKKQKLAPAIVLAPPSILHGRTSSGPSCWELWADKKGIVTARHLVGANAKSLLLTLPCIQSWKGVEALRVPKNFLDDIEAYATQQKLTLAAIAAVEPIRDGISVDLA
ncbi:MAG: hypothetical protein M4D80_28690 [Myxococcota bacterium]|nr:hypothetical protein [Myxococcota bacterium]